MLFLTCPSDLQCIGPTTAVKTTCLYVGWAVEGMGVGPKIHHRERVLLWIKHPTQYKKRVFGITPPILFRWVREGRPTTTIPSSSHILLASPISRPSHLKILVLLKIFFVCVKSLKMRIFFENLAMLGH